MKPDDDAQSLIRELLSINNAIAALEYFADARSTLVSKLDESGDVQTYTEHLKKQRYACSAAIAECERLAQIRRNAARSQR